jgi:hypothetical protein
VKYLHLYQIKGQIRFGEAEPIQSESKQEYQTILCEDRKLAGKYNGTKKSAGIMNMIK